MVSSFVKSSVLLLYLLLSIRKFSFVLMNSFLNFMNTIYYYIILYYYYYIRDRKIAGICYQEILIKIYNKLTLEKAD